MNSWVVKPLRTMAELNYGYTESATQDAVGPRFLRITDIQDNSVSWKDVPYCQITPQDYPKYRLRDGDIVFARTGATTGKSFLVTAPPEAVFASYLIRVRVNSEELLPDFVARFFDTPEYWREITNKQTGSAQGGFNASKLGALQVPVPPLPEQKRIAAILDAADALRAKRRESIEQLDSLVQATFLEMFGDPVTNPKGWQSKRIEDFCKTQTGGTPSRSKASLYYGGSIPWVKSGELREQTIYDTEEHITPKALEESAAKMVPRGALMVALYGATVGRIARLGIEAATNQAICSIIVPTNQASPAYMFQALREKVPEWLSRRVGGGQPNISNGVIKDTLIPLPPLPLQTRFASIVESIEQQKARLRAHLAELDTLFASLQSRAFNGELVA